MGFYFFRSCPFSAPSNQKILQSETLDSVNPFTARVFARVLWGNSNFRVCGRNPIVWPFRWKLSACTFTWCYLFVRILENEIWKFGRNLPLATFGSERVKKILKPSTLAFIAWIISSPILPNRISRVCPHKLVQARWVNIDLVLQSILNLNLDLANIQPSWPHAWSITQMYLSSSDTENYPRRTISNTGVTNGPLPTYHPKNWDGKGEGEA